MFIERRQLSSQLSGLLNSFRAVELVGPRQVGKTTLARQFIDVTSPQYFDLEDPLSRQRLAEPMSTLAGLNGLVVIDEIQHLPALPEALRVLMDRPDRMHLNGQYLLLGSAAPRVMHKSESMLGRAVTLEVGGFDISETGTGADALQQLWLRGGFPAAYLGACAAEAQRLQPVEKSPTSTLFFRLWLRPQSSKAGPNWILFPPVSLRCLLPRRLLAPDDAVSTQPNGATPPCSGM